MAAMNLAERLQAVTQNKKTEEYQKMSYDQLSKMRIAFGEAKVNQTYQEVLENDPKYVQWFVRKYGESKKEAHRAFLYFTNLYVERLELTQESQTPLETGVTAMGTHAKSKAVPKKPIDLESEESWSSEEGKPWSVVQEENVAIQGELSVQRERISHMESSLSQIMHQLQNLTQLALQNYSCQNP